MLMSQRRSKSHHLTRSVFDASTENKTPMKKTVLGLALAFLAGCGGGNAEIRTSQVWIDGYKYGFQVPRRDVAPGTLIVAWKNPEEKIDPICTLTPDAVILSQNPAISVSQGTKDKLKADAQATVLDLVKAKVGASATSEISTDVVVTPIALQNAGEVAKKMMADEKCKLNGEAFKKAHGQQLIFSLVTEVAEVTFTHTVKLTSGASVSAETQKELEAAIGTTASVALEGDGEKHLTIKGDKVFVNYNRDDQLVKFD